MSLNLGYAVSSVLFIGLFVVAVAAQIAVRSFHPFLYWLVVIATTTAGTRWPTLPIARWALATRAETILFALLMLVSAPGIVQRARFRSIPSIRRRSRFLLVAILFSQTLGRRSATGWPTRMGYEGGALVFGAGCGRRGGILLSNVSRTLLFWSASSSRALGATVGDFLDKPVADGGLAISRFSSRRSSRSSWSPAFSFSGKGPNVRHHLTRDSASPSANDSLFSPRLRREVPGSGGGVMSPDILVSLVARAAPRESQAHAPNKGT